jgi:hypothetical protein
MTITIGAKVVAVDDGKKESSIYRSLLGYCGGLFLLVSLIKKWLLIFQIVLLIIDLKNYLIAQYKS